MLNRLRKSVASWLVKGLLLLLAASFGLWGIGDYLGGGGETLVAKVGDVEINSVTFDQHYRRTLRLFQMQTGRTPDPQMARELRLPEATLDDLVNRTLWANEADALSLRVPDQVVAADIRNNPQFQGLTGEFSELAFQQFLFTNGQSERGYVLERKSQLALQQLQTAIFAGFRAAPGEAVQRLLAHGWELRVADYVVFRADPALVTTEPDDTALAAFHDENADRYMAPEYRRLGYIYVAPEDVLDQISIGEDAVQAEYQSRQAEFLVPETRHVRQMLFPDEAAAKAAAERIANGESFTDVAKDALGLEPGDLELGNVTRDELDEAMREPVFALDAGATTDPVESPFGWALVTVDEITPPTEKSLEEVADLIRRDLGLARASDLIIDISHELQDQFAGGATIDEAAAAAGVKARHVEWVDRGGSAPEGSSITDLPKDRAFLELAFAMEEGEEPDVVDAADGAIMAIAIDGIREPAVRPLDTIRDVVKRHWRNAEAQKLARAEAEAMAAAIGSAGDLAAAAESAGKTLETTRPLMRQSGQPPQGRTNYDRLLVQAAGQSPFDGALQGRLFELGDGEVATGATADGTGYAVVRLKEIRPADQETLDMARDALAQTLLGEMAGDMQQTYLADLQRDFPVRTYPKNLDALY
ncbi:peptidylprolyl isomerase [Oceanibacterium hippocampi]|uniref:Parvulin-like PPIase n=1 Tax=Oceanibacterium hippocampi TaxID=745714 RepID=A0A1Y5T7N3_9PROT|nr:SurA N-terminal domain-containing protein [Oceanibacterium hippocampi]SLN54347.1 Peptidyl-prolyl cis-trans isomerase D [Oceanibacterium hippocampi]